MTLDSIIPDEFGSPYAEGAPRTPEREQARSELDLMSGATRKRLEPAPYITAIKRACLVASGKVEPSKPAERVNLRGGSLGPAEAKALSFGSERSCGPGDVAERKRAKASRRCERGPENRFRRPRVKVGHLEIV
jgi:hypothetical protein